MHENIAVGIPASAIDDYLSLPKIDRMSVYRSLSVSDRMRLDRQVRARKATKSGKLKKSKLKSVDVDDKGSNVSSLSPWLLTHIQAALNEDLSAYGKKTITYFRSSVEGREGEGFDV